MSYTDLDYQHKIVDRHIAKAQQCQEYGKLNDADVHMAIAEILLKGLKEAKPSYKEESLNNLAQALA